MANLRGALRTFLTDWRSDVAGPWNAVLANVAPDFEAVTAHLTLKTNEVIYPLRKGHGDNRAPAGSHVFRALDELPPDAVRAVLLGQDPYPKLARATGRSFEQGDLDGWDGPVAQSLQRMVQALAQFRQPDPQYVANDSAWKSVQAKILVGNPRIEKPRALFDAWQTAGVLCLNLGLTLSRFDAKETPVADRVQPAHMAMWKPVVRAILLHLVRRQGRELLVVLWGDKAQKAYDSMGVEAAAAAAGNGARLVVVRRPHPSADGPKVDPGASPFLRLEEPYTQANNALEGIGSKRIAW